MFVSFLKCSTIASTYPHVAGRLGGHLLIIFGYEHNEAVDSIVGMLRLVAQYRHTNSHKRVALRIVVRHGGSTARNIDTIG